MRFTATLITACLVAMVSGHAAGGEPITREQLLELTSKNVDPGLIKRLVECDCVAFDVDARAVLELSATVPTDVLHAAIDCRERLAAGTAKGSEGQVAPAPGALSAPAATGVGNAAKPAQVAPAESAVRSAAARPGVETSRAPAAGKPLTLSQVRTIAIVPFVEDGESQDKLTAQFRKQLGKRARQYDFTDARALAPHLAKADTLNSDTPLESVLTAGRAAGVDAVLVGNASKSTVRGYPRVRLSARLIEVNAGDVLWFAESTSQEDLAWHSVAGTPEGGLLSWHDARREATRHVVEQFP